MPDPECRRIAPIIAVLRALRWIRPGGVNWTCLVLGSDADILACLMSHMSWRTGRCDPALATIALEIGWCQRAVQDGLGRLRERGIVSWRRRSIASTDANGAFALAQTTNLYTLHPPRLWRLAAAARRAIAHLLAAAPEPGTWGDPPGFDGPVFAVGGPLAPLRPALAAALARYGTALIKKFAKKPPTLSNNRIKER